MHTGGAARARKAIGQASRQGLARLHLIGEGRTPVTGLIAVARLLLVSLVAVTPSAVVAVKTPAKNLAVRPLAAVLPQPTDTEFPSLALPSASPAVDVANTIGPPPPAAVTSSGVVGIPAIALTAYRNADRLMAQRQPECGVSWNLLAGIGQIESRHAFGGATDGRGIAVDPIYGPALDGSLPGNEIIVASRSNGHTTYARAMGPMQFLPSTWAHYAADGDGDGHADPQNLFDSTLAAARYLCSGGMNLRDRSQLITAVLRYNRSMPYTQNVLGWAEAYATGVPPGYLPPITGPSRPSGGVRPVATTNVGSTGNGSGGTAGSGATSTGNMANPGTAGSTARQTGGNGAIAGSDAARSRSSATGPRSTGTSGRVGIRGGAQVGSAGSGSSPRVTIGNGRTGGVRGAGR